MTLPSLRVSGFSALAAVLWWAVSTLSATAGALLALAAVVTASLLTLHDLRRTRTDHPHPHSTRGTR
jgi:hypothetical protein